MKKNELKTLKDFDPEPCCYGIMERDLKREAVKWIKELELLRNHCKSDYKHNTQIEAMSQISWIKYFFNITDEELGLELKGQINEIKC
jgi:hypothetical protein